MTYLEVGVWIPQHNYDKIIAPIKESVDPRLDYKYTYNMTSDSFFKNHVGDKMYDVIFIDGLHTEEQSYTDAKNSLDHLNDGGYIIMHDCNPTEEWHARENEEDDAPGPAWTGTVYKSFMHLKNDFRNYSCFVIDEDWGCGIITKRPILENIGGKYNPNISWKEFHENRIDLLQLTSYDKFLNIL